MPGGTKPVTPGASKLGEAQVGSNGAEGRITRLQEDFGGFKIDLGTLRSDVDVLKTDVSELKADVSVLKTDVSELKTDVSELKSDVSELKADVSGLKSEVGALAGAMSEVKAEQVNMRGELAGLRREQSSMRDELLAAITETRVQITAELRGEMIKGHSSIRAEVAGLRKAVEIVAVKLLSEPEVQEVRLAAG